MEGGDCKGSTVGGALRCGLDVPSGFFGLLFRGRIMSTCLIGLGANLNDRLRTLEAAVSRLAQSSEIRITGRSHWHTAQPIGGPSGQGEYLNGALRIETSLEPLALLSLLQQVEDEFGRQRGRRWDARTLDLDLLLYGCVVLETTRLTLPHPRMAFRRFVLEPACEVAADMLHPITGWTIARLLQHLQTAVGYVAITGAPNSGKTALATRLAESVSARLIVDPTELSQGLLDGPSGQSDKLAVELERLKCRAEKLEAATWPTTSHMAISDFWLEQSAAYAASRKPEDKLAEVEAALRQAQNVAMPPKLLVVLRTSEHNKTDEHGEISRAIAVRAARRAPSLLLEADDQQRAFDEVHAAIDAMQ